jgi:prolyl-tRNA synthetase
LEQNTLTIIRRDLGTKTICNLNDLSPTIANFKVEYYNNLYNKANKHLNDSIVEINSIDELDTVIKSGKIGLAYWCGEAELEKTIKEKTSAAPRCVKEDNLNDDNLKCFLTNKKAKQRIYIARSY